MTNIIRHRGPDDEGFVFFPDNSNPPICLGGQNTPKEVYLSNFLYRPVGSIEENKTLKIQLAFGHRRLSILDLSPAGHQPMCYSEGRYWITFNGEIYNYLEIKTDLESRGYKFTTRTDTEVILASYAEWGESCLNRFVGMWAFAIYDHALNEIFLARDRYGIKPLYYYFSTNGTFSFASEIKQFTVLDGWFASVNPQRAYDQLVYSFTDHTDETMFARVFQLPSGSFFKSKIDNIKPCSTGRINHNKWYSLNRIPFNGSFIEATESFKNLFERSVREHLNADVPVGTALSGGLDSSSIVCQVNRILKTEGNAALQKTFSSCSSDERYDERKWMDIVVNFTQIDAHFIYPQIKEIFELTPDIIWHLDEPYQSQSAFLAYNIFRLARQNGVKVLLNGQGADEYLGGYGQFTFARYAKMVKHLRFKSLFADINNSKRIISSSPLSLFKGIAYNILPDNIRRGIANITSSANYVKKVIDTKKFGINPTHPFDIIPVKYKSVPDISEHYTFYSTLPKYLRWEDRNSMAHSVEARVPFLDHRLVEFTYNLPDDFIEKDGITKRVMREAMKGIIPVEIKNRKDKMGFTTPEELWVKNENPALFRQKISEAISITGGIIKPSALAYFDKVVSGKVPFDYTYWRLILFSEWIKRFNIKLS